MNSITLLRNNQKLFPLAWLSDDPVQAGVEARAQLSLWQPFVQQTDAMLWSGTIDFGHLYSFTPPSCFHQGPATWLTGCRIDETKDDAGNVTKPKGTPGILLPAWIRFDNFSFGGACYVPTEDGGLLGWGKDSGDVCEATFTNCHIDASRHDWGFYSWQGSATKRTINISDSEFPYCRIAIAFCASGHVNQYINAQRVRFVGNANGSQSQGASSGQDVDKGGVLAAILNRCGYTNVADCSFDSIGLTTNPKGSWCPRIAPITNWYFDKPGSVTEFTLARNRFQKTLGTAQVWYDDDIRENGKVTRVYDDALIAKVQAENQVRLAEAMGGTNQDGTLKVWKP